MLTFVGVWEIILNFKNLLLISASLAIGFVGLAYLSSADAMYGRYGIEIMSTNEYNMVRGAYGGLFLAFACLFLLGALVTRFEFSALVAVFTFMLGFAIGRLMSITVDGMPTNTIMGLLIFEILYAVAAAFYLKQHHLNG